MVSGIVLFIGVLLAGAGAASNAPPGASVARLQAISPTSDRDMTSIVIEASDPVPYLTTHPEPLTLLVDLRNVSIEGLRNNFTAPRGNVAGVAVETLESLGAPVARIRVTLTREARFRVMSDRNIIRVDIENPERAQATPSPVRLASANVAAPAPASRLSAAERRRVASLPSATKLHAVRASQDKDVVRLTITGNGLIEPASAVRAQDLPHRFVLDLKGVSSMAPKVTEVGRGPVQQVRVATHSSQPLVTRVVVDLLRWVEPRIERGLNGGALALVFDESSPLGPAVAVADSQAGLKLPIVDEPIKAPAPPPQSLAVPSMPAATGAAPVEPTPAPVTPAPTVSVSEAPVPAPAGPAVSVPAPPVPAPPDPAVLVQQTPPAQPPSQAPPQTPTTPPPASQAGTPTEQRQYIGFPISLDFEGVDLQSVIRIFAQETGLNVVIDPSVTGTVNVNLREVPWDQALDIILRANKLGWTLDGTIVRIAPLAVLADEESAKAKLAAAQAESGELRFATRTLNYAKAAEVSPLLTKTVPLSTRGQIEVDPRTNTLIISDLPARVQKALDILTQLDTPQPQVAIEARIVQTNRTFAKQIGISWGISGRMAPELGNTSPLAFPNSGSITGRTGLAQGPGNTPSAVNLPATGATSALGIALGAVNGALNLDAAISALETKGQGRLLSAPHVTTQNNVAAEMYQGVQIPLQTISNNTVTVTFKDAALSLKVTPQITAAGTVVMQVLLENAAPDFTKAVNGIPPIDTQRAATTMLVADGETTVLGGVYLSREQALHDRTPGLGSVPILNWLFKRDSFTEENRELLVFITPRIVRPPAAPTPPGLE